MRRRESAPPALVPEATGLILDLDATFMDATFIVAAESAGMLLARVIHLSLIHI